MSIQRVQQAIQMLRAAQGLEPSSGRAILHRQREASDFIETLTDDECRAVIRVVDAEGLRAPRNLSFNYTTQTWRV